MTLSRRGFFGGLIALVAAPFVIRTPGLIMPVRKWIEAAPLWPRVAAHTLSTWDYRQKKMMKMLTIADMVDGEVVFRHVPDDPKWHKFDFRGAAPQFGGTA